MFSCLLPTLYRNKVTRRVMFFSVLDGPLPNGYRTKFVRVVNVFVAYYPTVTRRNAVFAVMVMFVAKALRPPNRAFTINGAMMVVAFVLGEATSRAPL